MQLEKIISLSIQKGIHSEFGYSIDLEDIILQNTKKEFEGVYTFVVFNLSKILKQSPQAIAQKLGDYIVKNTTIVSKFGVVQGFLNLSLTTETTVTLFKKINETQKWGQAESNGRKALIEFSSPNTNKPLHLGHLRNNFLGDSLSNILEFSGYEVIKTTLVNDRGIHICKSMLAYQRFSEGETPANSLIKGDHLVGKYYVLFDKLYKTEIELLISEGLNREEAEKKAPILLQAQEMLIKWEKNDSETIALWTKMNRWVLEGFDETYKKLGISFHKVYYESETYLLGKNVLKKGIEEGIFYQKTDSSVWIDLTNEGLDEKLLLRSDGTSVYITQDLGTSEQKYSDFTANKHIYVVGSEQDYHFKVLFEITKKMKRPYAAGNFHLSYGMVELPSGRMKSREGTVVDADDLVAEMCQAAKLKTTELGKIEGFSEEEAQKLYHILGLGALKYFILKIDPKKKILFNPEESIDLQGNTAPFIQYTHARICAILRKATQLNLGTDWNVKKLNPIEEDIIYFLNQFPFKVIEAAEQYSPAIMAQYVYDLAKLYNTFYNEFSIFGENDPNISTFRVQLSKACGQTIKQGLKLLSIESPERM